MRLRRRGPDARVDQTSDDEFVELTTLPLINGPLVVSAFEAAGIDVQHYETFTLGLHSTASVRVMVRRRDVPAANALLADVLS